MGITGERDSDQAELRQRLRAMRLRLGPAARREAAAAIADLLPELPAYRAARRIAGYHAVGGELSPRPSLERAHAEGKSVYLPVLDTKAPRRLRFAAWHPGMAMRENCYGIPEPANGRLRDPADLDLVLTPLVACDRSGNRVGMGGGYYDTTFAFRLHEPVARPYLAGMAYDFQIMGPLEPNTWDVPMDWLLTPSGLIECG